MRQSDAGYLHPTIKSQVTESANKIEPYATDNRAGAVSHFPRQRRGAVRVSSSVPIDWAACGHDTVERPNPGNPSEAKVAT